MSSTLFSAREEDQVVIEDDTLQLVDVDCNLWHKDLKPLVPSTSKSTMQAAGESDGAAPLEAGGDDEEDLMGAFAILDDDDMTQCAAVLSPSSTVRESQRGLRSLRLRQRKLHSSVGDNGDTSTSLENGDGARRRVSSILPIRTTVGIHPYHVNDEEDCRDVEASRQQLEDLLSDPNYAPHIAAVGECGLDASPGFPPLSDQIPYFRMQVELASQHNQPLFVHERLAFESCCQILDDLSVRVPVIIHCFTGTRDECVEYVRSGYYLSISGYIFKDDSLGTILEEGIIPLDRLMVETDAPYMGFAGCRSLYLDKHSSKISSVLNAKQRKKLSNSLYPNVPSSLVLVFDKVWEHVNIGRVRRHEPEITRGELARITTRNAINFFGFNVPSFVSADS